MIQHSYRIELGEFERVRLILAGCGGTGSFAALHLARLGWVLQEKGLEVKLMFVDPDTVEAKNVGRQNFCPAEIGQAKASTLAWRYAAAFGLDIFPVEKRFETLVGDTVRYGGYDEMVVVVGCVDTPEARREIRQMPWGSRCWWLDSGNDLNNGQILLGNWHQPECTIDPLGFATMVPLPSVQEPGLILRQAQDEVETRSCAELLVEESQSLMINQMMASWIGTYLARLLLSQDLDVMATYINLDGAVRSTAITGERQELAVDRAGPPVQMIGPEEWLDEEWLEIADGTCPECGGGIAEGRDVYDEREVDIVFCPTCTWQLPVEEVEARLLHLAEAEDRARVRVRM